MILQPITTTCGKFFQESRSPIGSVHLIRIIEEGTGKVDLVCLESLIKLLKVRFYGHRTKMIHDIPFSPGSRTLYFLKSPSHKQCHQLPVSCRSIPLQISIFNFPGQIHHFSVCPISHQTIQVSHIPLFLFFRVTNVDFQPYRSTSLYLITFKNSFCCSL